MAGKTVWINLRGDKDKKILWWTVSLSYFCEQNPPKTICQVANTERISLLRTRSSVASAQRPRVCLLVSYKRLFPCVLILREAVRFWKRPWRIDLFSRAKSTRAKKQAVLYLKSANPAIWKVILGFCCIAPLLFSNLSQTLMNDSMNCSPLVVLYFSLASYEALWSL